MITNTSTTASLANYGMRNLSYAVQNATGESEANHKPRWDSENIKDYESHS